MQGGPVLKLKIGSFVHLSSHNFITLSCVNEDTSTKTKMQSALSISFSSVTSGA